MNMEQKVNATHAKWFIPFTGETTLAGFVYVLYNVHYIWNMMYVDAYTVARVESFSFF